MHHNQGKILTRGMALDMMMNRFSVFLIQWIVCASPSLMLAGDIWKAGTAKVNITPDKFMWMSGYGSRNRPADGMLTDLWAKVLVIEDESGNRACLITCDLVGVSREFSQLVTHELRARYNLQRSQISICASHTHTGPVLERNLDPLHFRQIDANQQKLVRNYSSVIQGKIVNAVHSAIHNMQECRLVWGSGRSTFAVNRRENRPESNVPKWRTAGTLKGPFDHDVPVLAVRDKNGSLKAVVFGYACHATVLSFYQWSGDYPGFAQMELEKLYPEAVAMFWAGCGADQNPLPRRSVELAKHYGARLATAVNSVLLTSEMQPLDSKIETEYNEINLSFASIPTNDELKVDANSSDKYIAARAQMFLQQIEQGRRIPSHYPYPVGTWRIGNEAQFVFLGGEVVVDFAIRLKTELRQKRTWVSGYANDVMAYIPSRRVLREGGYEGESAMVYYGLPSAWAPDVEKLIIDEVHRQLK